MLNIVCVNAGNYQGRGSEYVNVLFDMIRRNLAEGFPGKFVCFTDNPEGLDPSIETRAIQPGLKGWFNKLYLFKSGVFKEGDRVLYFDLDTLITGRLDEIAGYQGEFAILRDFYRPDGWQSAVMAWNGGFGAHLWDEFEKAGFPDVVGGDQAWIEQKQNKAEILQDLFPNLFISYKTSGRTIPKKASVVCFHGIPRPHEVLDGWVPQVWQLGGITRAELDTICNVETATINAHIESACKRDLPFLMPKPDHDGHVCIVGGGPWLPDCLDEIKAMQKFGHKVWALNNTHDWLIERGIIPDACVILDARKENSRFVEKSRYDVRYYVASQCHPRVFDSLRGRKVTVYNNATEGAQELLYRVSPVDEIHLLGGGTTVGMKAIAITRFLGFKHFHLYGMDSCYRNGEGHAYPQDLNDGERLLNVMCEGQSFTCAPWMATQANDFIELAGMLVEQDCVLTVAGEGLLASVARNMMRPQLKAADLRAIEIIKRLNVPYPVGAEIGVFTGELSVRLLSRPDLTLHMVDSWAGDGQDYAEDSGDWHARLSQDKQDAYYRNTVRRVQQFGERAKVVRKSSTEAAKDIPDESLDFVFIDADHSYTGCKADIEAWWPKVKPGGVFGGHDYENTDFPKFGVTQAVNEFSKDIELGENFTWFTTKPIQPKEAIK